MAPGKRVIVPPLAKPGEMDWRAFVVRALAYTLLLALAVSTLFPFYWMVANSFKEEQKIFRVPPQWFPQPLITSNYTYIFTTMPFGRFLFNSARIALLSTVGHLLASSLAAYAFARVPFPGRGVWFTIVLATMMIPYQVTIIPSYLIMDRLSWIDTSYPLWVPSFLGGAFGIFLVRQYMLTLPQELMDAARIDGCTHFGIYWRVVLPLSKPVLATLALISFMGSWNDLLGPLMYLNSEEKITLTLALTRFQGHQYSYYGKMMAGATISVLPVAVIFLFTQQYFVQGVTLTGLKG